MLMIAVLVMTVTGNAQGQEKTKYIGNKPREGSSNSSINIIKGEQHGIMMKAGSKPVQLLNLNFGVDHPGSKKLRFKVNVYEFNGILSGENFVKEVITGEIPTGKSRVNVDLRPYNLIVKRKILVTIEWLETVNDANPHFAIGILNGGSYEFTGGKWKRIPVVGFDFNITVKKV